MSDCFLQVQINSERRRKTASCKIRKQLQSKIEGSRKAFLVSLPNPEEHNHIVGKVWGNFLF